MFLFCPPFLFFLFVLSFDLSFTSFLTIETFITFSHDFKYLFKQKNMGCSWGSSMNEKKRVCKFLTSLALFWNGSYAQRGHAQDLYLNKKDHERTDEIIKKLPISGNRLAFCRLLGLAKKKYGFSLDRLKSLATSFHFLKLSNSSVHRS